MSSVPAAQDTRDGERRDCPLIGNGALLMAWLMDVASHARAAVSLSTCAVMCNTCLRGLHATLRANDLDRRQADTVAVPGAANDLTTHRHAEQALPHSEA